MLRELVKVKVGERLVIDPAKHYKKKNEVFFELNENQPVGKTLLGTLEKLGDIPVNGGHIQTWSFVMDLDCDSKALQPEVRKGYSGSPVVNRATGQVIGVLCMEYNTNPHGVMVELAGLRYLPGNLDFSKIFL